MKKTLLFAAFIGLVSFGKAQYTVPQAFNYQAVLRDHLGQPIPNHNVSLRLSILVNSTSGPATYVEKHDTTTNQFGLINILIGKGTVVSGSFANVNFYYDSLYLKVEMDTSGTGAYTTMGTSQLNAVPFAECAKYAGPWQIYNNFLNFNQISTIWFSGNPYTNVGVGTSTPDPSAIMDLSSNNQGFLVPRLTTSLMNSIPSPARGLLVFNIDSSEFCFYNSNFGGWENVCQNTQYWSKNGYNVYYTLGYVGIGNSSPQTPLQVSSGDVYIDTIGSGVIMKSPNGNCWRLTVDNSGNPVFTAITCP